MVYDKVIYLSDMTVHGWKTRFKEIRKKFGYSEKEDYLSAKKLDSLSKPNNNKFKRFEVLKSPSI